MILVLGGTGTVGRNTVASLKRLGARFKLGTRSTQQALRLEVDRVEFDWTRPETYAPALAGIETVFLLTPVSEQQIAWSHDLVQAAKGASVSRIVKLSVAGADREPAGTVARLHRATEQEIEASGMRWTFLRPNFLMQNFTTYYGVIPEQDSTVYLPNGTGKVSWLDARDLGDVAARALVETHHDGKAYTLTGAAALDTGEACRLLARGTNKRVDYVDIPEAAARDNLSKQGMPPAVVAALLELHMIIRNGWAEGISPELGQLLGREPRSFAQFARDMAGAFRSS
jgi:uncharacterized protein YbjT (DUF2867 family)